jgi:hypothetical protein
MDKVQVPAILTRVSFLKDGGVSLGFATNELLAEEKVVLSKFYQKFGWLVFKENELTPEDIPTEDADFEGKTPSKRMRAVLFVYWKQKGEQGNFEDFYRNKMNELIEYIKTKLD